MIKVLIADDHSIFRQGLGELLGGDPSLKVVGMASNGKEAVELVRSLGPDLLILDISMPVMDGFEVMETLREEGLGVRVVMLSMIKDPVSTRKAYELGVDGFVLKEEAFSDLMYAVRGVAKGLRFFSPAAQALLAASPVAGKAGLSPREREVATLIAQGKGTKEISSLLSISVKTVETHRQRIMEKLDCHKATEIAAYAVKSGWVK